MKTLIVDQQLVRRLLPMGECIDLMAEALAELGRGQGLNPLRTAMVLPDRSGILGMMPSGLSASGVVGIKVITVFPGNHGTELDSHQGAVLLFEAERGRLLAVAHGSEITAIRTAAVSGLATRLLARPDSALLAILGSGVQATTHLDAILEVRPIERVRVWSRNQENAAAFARLAGRRVSAAVESVGSAQEAVRGADVVCTTTSSSEPVLLGEWLQPGVHVNAVGSSVPTARELDTAAVARSRLFVDRRESTLNEAGDFLIPKAEGAIGDEHIVAELGEVLDGTSAGRRDESEITLFKSLGLGVEDLAAIHHIYRRAVAEGVGVEVGMSGLRPDLGGDGGTS